MNAVATEIIMRRRNVHQVNVLAVYLDELVAPTAGYTVVYEVVVLVERLGSLADDVLVLDVRGHVANLVGNVAADLAGSSSLIFSITRYGASIKPKSLMRA